MQATNEHIFEARDHLIQAVAIMELEVQDRYCSDVPKGRIVALLDLFARLQALRRLSTEVTALVATEPMAAAARHDWPLRTSNCSAGSAMD